MRVGNRITFRRRERLDSVTKRRWTQLTNGKGFTYPLYFFGPTVTRDGGTLIFYRYEDGQVQNWKAELTSANHLAPKGWTESSVEAGDDIAITGYRAKNGAPSIWVTKIHLANGQELGIDTAN